MAIQRSEILRQLPTPYARTVQTHKYLAAQNWVVPVQSPYLSLTWNAHHDCELPLNDGSPGTWDERTSLGREGEQTNIRRVVRCVRCSHVQSLASDGVSRVTRMGTNSSRPCEAINSYWARQRHWSFLKRVRSVLLLDAEHWYHSCLQRSDWAYGKEASSMHCLDLA